MLNIISTDEDEYEINDETDESDVKMMEIFHNWPNPLMFHGRQTRFHVLRFLSLEIMEFRIPMDNSKNTLDIFELFFDDNLIEIIVRETNRYANQYLTNNQNIKTNSRVKKWEDTNKVIKMI
jgi:hypothetical protein